MDYKKYLKDLKPDEKSLQAYLLWLFLDYKTETYDWTLPAAVPSKYDVTAAVFTNVYSRQLSSQYQFKCRQYIQMVAKKLEIPQDVMSNMRNPAGRYKAGRRIKEYKELKKRGQYVFLEQLLSFEELLEGEEGNERSMGTDR